jgi:hypothetical protein
VLRLVLLIAFAWASSQAIADAPAPHVLRWTRAPGAEACTDSHALRARVAARLGRDVFIDDDQQAISIEGHVRPSERGWQVAISVRGPDAELIGQRELEEPSADCRELDDALALMIALIVDPDAAMRAPAPPQPKAEPPPPPPPSLRPPIRAPSPPSEPWRFTAAASFVVGASLLPGANAGAALHAAIDAPSLPPIVVRGSLWPSDQQRNGERGAQLWLVTGGLSICPRVWRFALCGGVELGRMAGDGFGFDRSQHSASFVSYVTLEPNLVVPITPRIDLLASIGAWFPLVRPRFVFEQNGQDIELYQPSLVALVTHLGLRLHF